MDTFPDMKRIRGHNVIFHKTGDFLNILISFILGDNSTSYFLKLTKVI